MNAGVNAAAALLSLGAPPASLAFPLLAGLFPKGFQNSRVEPAAREEGAARCDCRAAGRGSQGRPWVPVPPDPVTGLPAGQRRGLRAAGGRFAPTQEGLHGRLKHRLLLEGQEPEEASPKSTMLLLGRGGRTPPPGAVLPRPPRDPGAKGNRRLQPGQVRFRGELHGGPRPEASSRCRATAGSLPRLAGAGGVSAGRLGSAPAVGRGPARAAPIGRLRRGAGPGPEGAGQAGPLAPSEGRGCWRRGEAEKLVPSQKHCKRNPDMEIESTHPLGQKQVELHGNSVEGQSVRSGDTWLQSPSKAALPEQLQVVVEQLQYKRHGRLGWMQSLKCGLEGQHQTLEMLLQECQALKAQLRQSKAVTQEQERERALQIEWHQRMREQLRQAEASVHILESSLDLYKKKYQAALGRAGGLERQVHHLQEEARRKAARWAEKLDNPWSSGQAENSLGQLGAREIVWDMQLTGQQDQAAQELQEQLAASHSKLLQQKEALASLRREFASYKLTHSCSNTKHRKQMVSQVMLHQKLQQAGEAGLQQQAEAYQTLVQELKLQLAREAEQNSRTLKDLARLELAVQSLCQEAATEQSQQLQELAVLQHQACPVQVLLEQGHQLCAQKEWKAGRPIQRAWANCRIFWDQAHLLNAAASQEAKQGRAASWSHGVPVLQLRRPKKSEESQEAAVEMAQDRPVKRDLQLQCLGKDGCQLELLLGRGCLGEAELEHKSFLGGGLPAAAAATSAREQLKELMEELSRSKQQPLQAAAMLKLEMLRQQLQETEWRVQALQACVMEQKAESRSLQEQLTKQTAVLGLVHGRFRQAWLQLQHQATEELLDPSAGLWDGLFRGVLQKEQIDSLQISLEASRAGHHWLHQESELVVADVRQWVKEQKQMNEELGHKLRMQIKQIAQLTGERDLLHQLLERLQEDNQQLKNEAKEKRIVCERIKALHKSDLEPQAVLKQLWHILLL